jgi:hypothetical protein
MGAKGQEGDENYEYLRSTFKNSYLVSTVFLVKSEGRIVYYAHSPLQG